MIYAVINQKGGVGKSTTALELWAGLHSMGYKCLAVDLDAQCNLSFSAGADDGRTVLELLVKKTAIHETIRHTAIGDIIPADKALSGADAFITETGKEYRLKEALEPVTADYDYIIIDTPPALGILTVNALTACDSIIIPAQADIYSIQGIEQLAETIRPVKKYCNPALDISGILLTRYNSRAVLSRDISEVVKQLAEKLDTKLFNATIREAVSIRESQLNRQSIFDYAPKSNVADDYRAFISELLNGGENNE